MIEQAPGVYRDMPEETYHRSAGASNSLLNALDESPSRALFNMMVKRKPKPAHKLGRAVHCLAITPHLFTTSYNLNLDRKTSPDDEVTLGSNDYELAQSMVESLRNHPIVSEILAGADERELSVFWIDNATGVLCKARMDLAWTAQGAIYDIKTSAGKKEYIQSAGLEEFEATLTHYHYYRQGAHYIAAAEAAALPLSHFVNIAIEKEARAFIHGAPAHEIGVYEIEPEDLDVGAEEIHELLKIWKSCQESNEWPPLCTEIRMAGRTAWAKKNDKGER